MQFLPLFYAHLTPKVQINSNVVAISSEQKLNVQRKKEIFMVYAV